MTFLVRSQAFRRAWPLAAALGVIVLITMGVACSKHGRPAFASAFLLPDMMVDLPVRPITWFTDEPIVEQRFVDYGEDRILADIYRPGDDKRHAAVIFSMGAPPLDLDDSRLVKLAEDAARAGLVMIVPFSERLDDEVIASEEIDALVGLFEYAEAQPYVDPERIGYIGVSVGGSLALVAAEDPAIAERVDFVVSFGGYHNGLDALQAIGRRSIEYEGAVEDWDPDDHSVEVMAIQLLIELPDPDDRATVCKAFVDSWDWHLCEAGIDDERPVAQADVDALTPQGRVVYDFMLERDAGASDALRAQLPQAVVDRMTAVSPDQAVDRLTAELYIIHDRGDEFVPYVESRRLRDALDGRDDLDVHYTEVSLFEHVEPRLSRGGDVIVIDGARLYFRLYQLLLELT